MLAKSKMSVTELIIREGRENDGKTINFEKW